MGQFEIGYYPVISLEMLGKIAINIGQNRRCSDRGMNQALPKYK
jgi:hypothetical protein